MTKAHTCFTDSSSREAGARDPVLKINMDARFNWEILPDPTGGALLDIYQIYGTQYIIKALDLLKAPPTVEWLAQNPQYHFWCTQWGKYVKSSRFPQMKNALAVHGIPEAGISMPLISMGGYIMIDKTSCTPILTNGAPFDPYRN